MANALTCKNGAAGRQRHGETMVTALYVFCVLCVVVWVRCSWFLGVPRWCAIYCRYYGIVLGVDISIKVLDTYAILVKYFAQKYGRRKKPTNQLYCVCCVL